MFSKLLSLPEAGELIQDGQMIAVGGNSLHRNPATFCHELVRQQRRGLRGVGAAHGYAMDVLCAGDVMSEVYFGFFGFENEYGLAPGMRKGMQEGKIKAMEGSCSAIINGLRAGAYGIPFIGVGGMWGSELITQRPELYQVIKSPFTGEEVVTIKALNPDWAIIHVQEADEYGNARILGSEFQDVIMTRAAKKTIITTEKLVDTETFKQEPKLTSIPHFLVEAVVLAPQGAKPGICYPGYLQADPDGMKAYSKAVKEGTLESYLETVTEGLG
jgi:glutaconate CoA-transferase subunit A